MGIGRQVADAYIDVHGDTTKFRSSLDKAAVQGRKAGREAADGFAKAWAKRSESEFGRKWDAVLDAAYSNKKVDWNRLIPLFDASTFDDATKKIQKFMQANLAAKKLDREQYDSIMASMRGQLKMLDEEQRKVAELAETREKERRQRLSDEEALQWQMAQNIREQERYNKSFANLFRMNNIRGLEADFNKIADAMAKSDWSKWTKGSDDIDTISERVRLVVGEMNALGRVTDEQGKLIISSVEDHVRAEKDRAAAVANSKEEAERFKKSLDNLVGTAGLKEMERDFQRITRAMATANWGPVSKDFTNIREFRVHVEDVADAMRRNGRISDAEFSRVSESVQRASRHVAEFNVELSKGQKGAGVLNKLTNAMSKSWGRMDSTVKMVMTSILVAAGPLATILSGVSASMTAVVSSAAMAAASFVPLVAAGSALAMGIFLAVSAFDEIKARLPGIQQSLDSIGSTWSRQAKEFGDAWGDSLDALLATFAERFAQFDIGNPLGRAFADISDTLTALINGPAFTAFMEAMETDLPAAVSGLGSGFVNLFGGLMSLMAGAAPVAKLLGEDFARWGTNIAASLEEARNSGKLEEVFGKARESLLSVFDLAGSVGSALGTMFMLGADTGNSLLDSLTRIVDKFNEWMHTDDGRQKMLDWFANGAEIIRSFEPLVVGLGEALGKLVTPHSIEQVGNLNSKLGESLPVIGDLLSALSDLGVLEILASLLDNITSVLEPMMPAFKELAEVVGDVLVGAMEELTPLFEEAGEGLTPLMELLAQLAKDVLPPLVPVIGAIIGIAVDLIKVLAEVIEFVAPLLEVVGKIVAAVIEMDGIKTIIEGIGATISGALEIMIGLLTGDWDRAWQGAKDMVGGVGEIFTGMWEIVEQVLVWLTDGFNALWTTIQEIFAPLGEWFAGVWDGIRTGAEEFGTGIGTFFSDTWTNISTGVSDSWNGMKDSIATTLMETDTNIREKLDGFWTKFDEVFPGTRALAEDEWNKMATALGAATNLIKENVSTHWDQMKQTASDRFNEIKTNTETAWTAVGTATNLWWTDVSDTVRTAADDALRPVKEKWGEIKKDTEQRWGEVRDAVNTRWDDILGKTRTTATELGHRAGEAGNSVRDRIMGPVNHLRGMWDGAWNQISSVLSHVWGRMKQAALDGINSLMQWMIQLPGRIIGGISSLPGQMATMGSQMMQGMMNGISNMAGSLVRSAVSAAQNAVQAVKNFLGIASPSKLFTEIGGFMGEGMVIGLDRSAGQVASAATALADAAVGEFAGDRMFGVGADAASRLAEGLASNRGLLSDAIGDLQPTIESVGTRVPAPGTSSGAGESSGEGGRTVIVESGAIRLDSKVSDPGLAADMVLDELINNTRL